MKILIACECSGRVRRAFRERGHDAWSCDILPSEDNSRYHIEADVLTIVDNGWDMMIAHPPCTYLSSSGLHWNKRVPLRATLTREALCFVFKLLSPTHGIKRIAIENPIGILSTVFKKPDQIIQPYNFGDNASKSTCLWLTGLPLLRDTKFVVPRNVNGKNRWANQTDSGQNNLPPSADRSRIRSATYPGIAAAMAEQWG